MKIALHNIKLILSLVTNFAAKAPSIFSVVFLLPVVRHSLGVEGFNYFLSSFALAGVFAAPFGGIGVAGRRAIGESIAFGSQDREANAVVSQISIALIVSVLAGIGIFIANDLRGAPHIFALVGLVSLLGMFLNTFDNIRGAYNEHYITASLQFLLQISVYLIAILAPFMTRGPIISAFTLLGPMAAASLITGLLLFMQRRYLLGGKPNMLGELARGSLIIALADGALMASLNFSVVWISSNTTANTGAWYGSLVRLFLTILTPAMLLLFPIGSYLNLLWHGFDVKRKNLALSIIAGFSLLYGITASAVMAAVGYIYLPRVMALPMPIAPLSSAPIFIFLGAIVAQKAYSSVAFLVFDGKRFSAISSGVVVFGIFIAWVSSMFTAPITALSALSLAIGIPLFIAIVLNVASVRRSFLSLDRPL